jgi:hypothetical protein
MVGNFDFLFVGGGDSDIPALNEWLSEHIFEFLVIESGIS